MKKLRLDFRKSRPASPAARWVLLALAVAFAADLAVSYSGLRQAVAQSEARLLEARRPADGRMRASAEFRAPSAEEMRVARDTIERLAMPWDSLFRTLEATANDKVALLAIEPDAGSGAVLISGEALDYTAALEYVAQLSGAGTLGRAHLVRHHRQQDDPQQPVSFSISAAWRKAR